MKCNIRRFLPSDFGFQVSDRATGLGESVPSEANEGQFSLSLGGSSVFRDYCKAVFRVGLLASDFSIDPPFLSAAGYTVFL